MGNANQSLAPTGAAPSGLEWTLGDRLAKSLKYSGMKAQDMAEIIGVARNTISNYVNDHTEPSKLALKEWALRTGVPYEWLVGDGANRRTWVPKVAGSTPVGGTLIPFPTHKIKGGYATPISGQAPA